MEVRAKGLWYERAVHTDEAGRFTFDGLWRGSYTVSTNLGREGAAVAVEVEDAEPTRVVLKLQPCAVLEGGVTDGAGVPLAEAEVLVEHFAVAAFEQTTRTDARGHYQFVCLPPGPFTVTARAKGFTSRGLDDLERELVPGESLRGDFRLTSAAPFEGIVVDTEGKPLPDAWLMVYEMPEEDVPTEGPFPSVELRTGEDGRFSADGLAPGLYGVEITSGSEAYVAGHEEVQLPNTGARFVLERAPQTPGVIAGTVVDERGQPLPGVHLWAESLASQQDFSARTDDLGQFRLERLRVGSWRISAAHEAGERQGQEHASARVEVQGPEPVLVKLRLVDGLSVSGQVVDGQGTPLPRVFVSSHLRHSASEDVLAGDSTDTDEQGRFTLRHLLPGDYTLTAHPPPNESSLAYASATARAGDTGVRLVMGPPRQVHGRVLRADGSPVPAFLVNGVAFSGTQGRFSLPQPRLPSAAQLLFVFTAEGLAPTLRRMEVKPERDAVLPDVTMARGAPVRGRVLDAHTGAPIEAAGVVPLAFETREAPSIDPDQGWVLTREDGRFLLPSVLPGVVLTVEHEDYETAQVPVPRIEDEVVIRLRPLTASGAMP